MRVWLVSFDRLSLLLPARLRLGTGPVFEKSPKSLSSYHLRKLFCGTVETFFFSLRFSQKTESVYALNLSYETAERIPRPVNNKGA